MSGFVGVGRSWFVTFVTVMQLSESAISEVIRLLFTQFSGERRELCYLEMVKAAT